MFLSLNEIDNGFDVIPLIHFPNVSEHLISTKEKLSVPVSMNLQLCCIHQRSRYPFFGYSRLKVVNFFAKCNPLRIIKHGFVVYYNCKNYVTKHKTVYE